MTEFFVITLSHPNEAPVIEVAPTVDMRFNLETYLESTMEPGGRRDTYRVRADEHGDFPGEHISSRVYGE